MSNDQSLASTKDGLCGILSVQVPGSAERNVGVIVVDSQDHVHIKLSEVLLTSDLEILEYWSALGESLSSMGSDLGGRELLRLFEDAASNFLQLSTVVDCSTTDIKATLESMYRQHVVGWRERNSSADRTIAEVRAHQYSETELAEAMKHLPLSCRASVQTMRLFRQAGDPLKDLEVLLNGDPVAAGAIVRMANLSKFSRGGYIRSLKQALLTIGVDATLGYMVALSLRPLYSSPSLQKVWNDSIRCRNATELIAERLKLDQASELSLLALVSNIGKVVMTQLEGFDHQFNELRRSNYSPIACERILCRRDHGEIGALLLDDWGFEPDIIEAVRTHHNPADSASPKASVIFLAEDIAGLLDESEISEHENEAMAKFGLNREELFKFSSCNTNEWTHLGFDVGNLMPQPGHL